MILNFKSAMKSEEELRRSFDRLWNGIRNLSFDGMEVWDFIADNWTVQELEEFLSVWNDTSPSERRALFNCPQDTADDISLNLESTLDALRDEALMLIGALVFHDTTQSNATVARLSLGYEFEGYLARTIASLREKLPAPFFAAIKNGIDSNSKTLVEIKETGEETRILAGAAAVTKHNQLTTAHKNGVKAFKADKERQERKAQSDKTKNQLMTEVRQKLESNTGMSTASACAIVAKKHLKANGKPILSAGRLQNLMSEAKKKPEHKQ